MEVTMMNATTFNDIFYVVLMIFFSLVLRVASQYFSAKYADSKYAAAINDVCSAVDFVNQTFVDNLKKAGCFDDEAQRIAFKKAKDVVLDTMSESTYRWLEKTFSDLDSWLEVQIESSIKAVK